MQAIAVFKNDKLKISGTALFTEDKVKKETVIKIQIEGLVPNSKHGFHIHEKGDLREGCKSLCNHFNPYNTLHGDQKDKRTMRHVGDLGNVRANKEGKVNKTIRDRLIKLSGKHSVIGRSVILHAGEDDLGLGNNKESIITGNSGPRIACGVIGLA